MARPLRLEHEGATWHITARGNEKRRIFWSNEDRLMFLSLLEIAVTRFNWQLQTWVLMLNHYHLVINTPECTLSRGMHWLNSEYAQYINRKRGRVGHLFQGRFKGVLVDSQTYLNQVLRYVVLNPVRAGIVQHPGEYKWSSYRAHAGLEAAPEWLSEGWLLGLGDSGTDPRAIYRDYVAEKVTDGDELWSNLVGQIYLGSPEWVAEMRTRVESGLRSDEHNRDQRLLPRATMSEVVQAVAEACETEPASIRQKRGSPLRKIAAWIAWNCALLRLRQIAAGLAMRSAGHMSSLVRACDAQLTHDTTLQRAVDTAIERLRTRLAHG